MSPTYKGIKRLTKEHSNWFPIVKAALEYAKEYGEFAGSWIFNKAKKKGIEWFPGLKMFGRYEILRYENMRIQL